MQDPKYRCYEEGRDAKRTYMYSFKACVQLRWTDHVTRMPPMSVYRRKFSMENFRKESALNVAKRSATKTPLKPF